MTMTDHDEIRADLREAVTRGATWLDQAWPGWHNQIDTGILDMNNSERCVLGQLSSIDDQWYRGHVRGQMSDMDPEHGFYTEFELPVDDQDDSYTDQDTALAELAECWLAEITTRREA